MPSASQPDTPFADPAEIVAAALAALLPPDAVSTADYASQHRWLFNDGGGYVGRWRHELAPYLVEPMQELDNPAYPDVAVVGPGQSGKTSIAENWLLKSVGADPANFLWYMQTGDALKEYIKTQINPMIEQHDILRSRLGLNPIDDSLGFKRFRRMWVSFLPATYNNLVSKKAPRIVNDEPDAAAESLGDVRDLMDVRRTTFGSDSTILSLSHPDRATSLTPEGWNAGIMKLYRDSDRRTWWWPCPRCGEYSSPNPSASLVMTLNYQPDAPLDEIRDATRLLCPTCGGLSEDHERRAMNAAAHWVGLGQRIAANGTVAGLRECRPIAGFWIMGVMSTLMRGGIGGLAADLVSAERHLEATGEDSALRTVTVKRAGTPYSPTRAIGSVDALSLAERAEPEFIRGTVPAGVRFITAAVDVQGNRFEILYRGWGVEKESWVIDHQVIREFADEPVQPASSPSDWTALLDLLIDHPGFPLADGSGRVMQLRGSGVDVGDGGVTDQAYRAWLRQRQKRRVRYIGAISGRDQWNLLPLKGASFKKARNLSVVYPDTERRDRKAAARGEIPIGIFNPNWFKDVLAAQLGRTDPGPGHIHFPHGLRSEEPPHLWFEQLTAEKRKATGEWVKLATRNEALDLMVMSAVIAHLYAPSRFNWAAPPAWAQDWATNSLVRHPAAAASTPATARSQAAVAAADSRGTVARILAQARAQPLAQGAQGPAEDTRSVIARLLAEARGKKPAP